MSEHLIYYKSSPKSFYSSLNERKKIYCKDCRYYYWWCINKPTDMGDRFVWGGHRCLKMIRKKIIVNGNGVRPAYKTNKIKRVTLESNKNNNCKFYKRKWYKFWIKEK